MSGLFSNIFRRSFFTSNSFFSRQCPKTTKFKPTHQGAYKLYKNLTMFLAFPIVFTLAAYLYLKKHQECAEDERPPFIPYEHLRRHTKRWPWGEGLKSAFHNPKINPLPGIGYEDEQPEASTETTE